MSLPIPGSSRACVRRDHALMPPDSWVESTLVGWRQATAFVHIAPPLGAGFWQYSVELAVGGHSGQTAGEVERFAFVRSGSVAVGGTVLQRGGYVFLPAGDAAGIEAIEPAQLIVFEKTYAPLAGVDPPSQVCGNLAQVAGEPFQGDSHALLQTLLPSEPAFDMAVNVFTYAPGATLPQVEVHVMEHGMQLLAGTGIYRLGESWYPVAAGDVLWIGPFCPQWFAATGKEPASYIYYKDVQREIRQPAATAD